MDGLSDLLNIPILLGNIVAKKKGKVLINFHCFPKIHINLKIFIS